MPRFAHDINHRTHLAPDLDSWQVYKRALWHILWITRGRKKINKESDFYFRGAASGIQSCGMLECFDVDAQPQRDWGTATGPSSWFRTMHRWPNTSLWGWRWGSLDGRVSTTTVANRIRSAQCCALRRVTEKKKLRALRVASSLPNQRCTSFVLRHCVARNSISYPTFPTFCETLTSFLI